MSDAKDILGFELFNGKKILGKLKDNPVRALVGSFDPVSTKAWNKVLGRDDKPIFDQWGGASYDTYSDAERSGIDTKAGHNMQRVARAVAAYFAGSYGMSNLGGGGAGGTGGSGGSGSGMESLPNFPSMGQAQEPEQEEPFKPLEVDYSERDPVIVSSKTKKRPGAQASMADLMSRGLSGQNVIDQLGVRVGLIKEAGTELDQIEAQLDKLLSGAKR